MIRTRMSLRGPPARQSGAALLAALAAAALAAVLAMAMLERLQRDLARTGALNAAERSWQYARGMDVLARDWIEQARDTGLELDGRWSGPFTVPGGQVTARVFDLSGRFNLNALAHPEPDQAVAARRAFAELLGHLELNPALADELSAWVRGAGRASGADAAWYAGREPPYRSAGRPLAHVSELNWLRHVDADVRERLAPFVAALPDFETRINVNTTRPEVLAAWIDGLDPGQARQVLAARPYSRLRDVAADPRLRNLGAAQLEARFGLASDWYLAQARVTLDGNPRDFYRLIRTGAGGYDFRYMSQGVP